MLTARGQEIDKVVGLELGADDYVTKPFSIRELLARVRAILRRTDGTKKRLSRYRFADVELDFEIYRATKGGEPLDLSPREFELLRYLIERKGETVSREKLLEDVWGYESYPSTRTVDTHIAKLRAKIGDSGSEPRYILTIHGDRATSSSIPPDDEPREGWTAVPDGTRSVSARRRGGRAGRWRACWPSTRSEHRDARAACLARAAAAHRPVGRLPGGSVAASSRAPTTSRPSGPRRRATSPDAGLRARAPGRGGGHARAERGARSAGRAPGRGASRRAAR